MTVEPNPIISISIVVMVFIIGGLLTRMFYLGKISCLIGRHKPDENKINKSWEGRTSIYEYNCMNCGKRIHEEQYFPEL